MAGVGVWPGMVVRLGVLGGPSTGVGVCWGVALSIGVAVGVAVGDGLGVAMVGRVGIGTGPSSPPPEPDLTDTSTQQVFVTPNESVRVTQAWWVPVAK